MSATSSRRFAAAVLLVVCAACKPAAPAKNVAAGPRVRATVITIRTATQPGNRVTAHAIVVADNRARSLDEHDAWRLFDLKAQTVTFVDDVAKTVRVEPFASAMQRHRSAITGNLPAHYPRAQVRRTGAHRSILGTPAEQLLVETGAYRRELWIGRHPKIPADLFAMMRATDTPSSPLAPMMRTVDESLMSTRGFPLVDHSEVPLRDKKVIVDRRVMSVTTRDVPESLLEIPRGYLDLTSKKK